MVAGNTMASNLPQQLLLITGDEYLKYSTYSSTNKKPGDPKRTKTVPSRKEKRKKVKGSGHHDHLVRHDPSWLA